MQHARIARGLDQDDVAAAANIDQSYVSSIENGGWEESGDSRVRAYLEHIGIPNQNAILTLTQTMSKLHQDLLNAFV
ncbi:MAG: helix-turn-helix transcriptional regulator [Chloroflexi bacterium]|nr:helix-turn-helix transcriptional regulator [Chloroflexota bacterium]